MATLRKRHLACDGLGHANRPRLNDALGLDAQPRRLCLSSGWSRHTDTNANRNTYGYSDSNKYTYTCFKAYSDAEISPDASAASVSAASNVIGDR